MFSRHDDKCNVKLTAVFSQLSCWDVNDYCLLVYGVAPPLVFVVNLAPGYNKPEIRVARARLLLQGDQSDLRHTTSTLLRRRPREQSWYNNTAELHNQISICFSKPCRWAQSTRHLSQWQIFWAQLRRLTRSLVAWRALETSHLHWERTGNLSCPRLACSNTLWATTPLWRPPTICHTPFPSSRTVQWGATAMAALPTWGTYPLTKKLWETTQQQQGGTAPILTPDTQQVSYLALFSFTSRLFAFCMHVLIYWVPNEFTSVLRISTIAHNLPS